MANQIARRLRKHQTVAETNLWRELRKLRHHGYHFRRQVPIASYIVDFACLSQKVIIEVDGIQHDEPKAQAADAARDADEVAQFVRDARAKTGAAGDGVAGPGSP